ncbi:MAG TPA: aspartate aminotransferase family protein [Candidatus Limnocylindria bacterium]|nr:aspartate aminotransferase family protein [Candidatus Limnocylindria bacterium]
MSTKVATSQKTLRDLQEFESRNITYTEPDGSWPMVWSKARGMHVWSPEGRRYLDLTAAFGVAAAGHANPAVVRAGKRQMGTLLHAMGDVHPHPAKAELVRQLSEITFGRWNKGHPSLLRRKGKTILCNSGFEAVEAALKTAFLATGRREVIAFTGGYHGVGYGALNATHREHFRAPFRRQLADFATFVPFPANPSRVAVGASPSVPGTDWESILAQHLKSLKFGAVIVEPTQARGGINIPPPDFLPTLKRLCQAYGALLIVDEIYTGFGRTGRWFACEHSGVVPDLICLGKGLTGGFPLAACVGSAELMDQAWPVSQGEAIHTSTFLGHPVGCAMALAQIAEIKGQNLVGAARRLGGLVERELNSLAQGLPQYRTEVRVTGLMAGLEILHPNGKPATEVVLAAIKSMLHLGYILLPEGAHAEVISLTPPLIITPRQIRETIACLATVLGAEPTAQGRTKKIPRTSRLSKKL